MAKNIQEFALIVSILEGTLHLQNNVQYSFPANCRSTMHITGAFNKY